MNSVSYFTRVCNALYIIFNLSAINTPCFNACLGVVVEGGTVMFWSRPRRSPCPISSFGHGNGTPCRPGFHIQAYSSPYSIFSTSREEFHQRLGREVRGGGAVEDVAGEFLLLMVQFEDALLDRVRRNETVNGDGFALADAMRVQNQTRVSCLFGQCQASRRQPRCPRV